MTVRELVRILNSLPPNMMEHPVSFAHRGDESAIRIVVADSGGPGIGLPPRVILLTEFGAPESYGSASFLAAYTRAPFRIVSTDDDDGPRPGG